MANKSPVREAKTAIPSSRMPRRKGPSRPRRRRNNLAGFILAYALALPPVLGAAATMLRGRFDPLEPTPAGWFLDQAATLAAAWIVLAIAAMAISILGRRLAAGVLSLAALLVLSVAVLDGDRAERTGSPEGPVVRVLVCNAWSSGTRGDEQLAMIIESNADIVMLNEASDSLLAAMRSSSELRAAYPYFRLPDRAGPGFRFVLSRHPIARGADGFGAVWPEIETALGYHGARVVRVTLPQGPFVFAGVQFRSPRSAERWAAGNVQALDTARGIRLIRDATRLPVIMAGDLNASPVGVRSRLIGRVAGLARAKPALLADGTYPASLPWPARVPIDGALVSPGVRLVSYRTLEAAGSDHLAVLMELELPGQAAVPSRSASSSPNSSSP